MRDLPFVPTKSEESISIEEAEKIFKTSSDEETLMRAIVEIQSEEDSNWILDQLIYFTKKTKSEGILENIMETLEMTVESDYEQYKTGRRHF